MPSKMEKEIASYFLRVRMLFLFVNMIVYVRQSRENNK